MPNAATNTGNPIGTNGANATADTAPNEAARRPCRVRRCGTIIAVNNTAKELSRPKVFGSMDVPTKAPINVPRFQNE